MSCWQGEREGSIMETVTKRAEERQQQQTPSHGASLPRLGGGAQFLRMRITVLPREAVSSPGHGVVWERNSFN